jgi:MoaA/NifB/PqqE/SkfB family radical SAM enzyme
MWSGNGTFGIDKVGWLPLVQWDLAKFKKAFPARTINRYKKLEFCGTYGDPVMAKDLLDIVRYVLINTNDTQVFINTNGGIRSEQWWKDLGELGQSYKAFSNNWQRLTVMFDVDGITQEMHAKYRQNTNLEKVKQNIKAYCDTGAAASVYVVVFKHNQDYMHDIEEMVKELGVTGEVYFQESQRFHTDTKFTFINADGEYETLEQAEVVRGQDNRLRTTTPIRDLKWKKLQK